MHCNDVLQCFLQIIQLGCLEINCIIFLNFSPVLEQSRESRCRTLQYDFISILFDLDLNLIKGKCYSSCCSVRHLRAPPFGCFSGNENLSL